MLLEDSRKNGHKIIYQSATPDRGYFIPVTIIDNPPDNSRIVREERKSFLLCSFYMLAYLLLVAEFGPIVPLLKWSDDDEVIKRASMCIMLFSLTDEY